MISSFVNIAVVALASLSSITSATYSGFNYGSSDSLGEAYRQQDFENFFNFASELEGTNGEFTAARLYTTIQAGTTNDPIEAIPAAIAKNTKLLLGLWVSGGDTQFQNDLTALKSAISKYGDSLKDLVIGISVGSEDLYRESIAGIQNNAGVGVAADTVVKYIKQVRSAISGTSLSDAPIGHVDTWTAWVNGSNAEVISNSDWIGYDGYPYFQNTMANSIDDAKSLFDSSYQKTLEAAGDVPVWITETGWPVSGKQENEGVASAENAQTYWQEVGCGELFGKVNTFWYTLYDGYSSPSFGVVGSTLGSKPVFDLSCSANSSSSSSSSTSEAASSSEATSSSVATSSAAATSSAVATSTIAAVASADLASSSLPTASSTVATVASVAAESAASTETAAVPVASGSASKATELSALAVMMSLIASFF